MKKKKNPKIKIFVRESDFLPEKKTKRNHKIGREEKRVRRKKS